MKELVRRVQRLEAQVLTRDDYIAYAVSEGIAEADARATYERGDAWRRAHPTATVTEEAAVIAAEHGITVDELLRAAEDIRGRVRAYKAARGARHACS